MPEIYYGMLDGMMCLFFFRGFLANKPDFPEKEKRLLRKIRCNPRRLLVLFLLAVEFQHTVFDFLAVAENFEDA